MCTITKTTATTTITDTDTANIAVLNGFVSFCAHFNYLGTWVSFSLHDNFDITKRFAAENTAMGSLNPLWDDEHVDTYSKYLLFWSIPCNLLLWVYKLLALHDTLLSSLNVFLKL